MRALVVLLLALVAVSAVPRRPNRIIGGSVTSINQYPEMASLLFSNTNNNHRQSCGGVVINNRSVLTAAHCTDGNAPGRWRVRVGSTNANSGGVVHNSQQLINHPQYNRFNFDNDIAIIRTASSIIFSNVVRAASIAGPNYNVADNQVVWATGWGLTGSPHNTGNPQPSEQLRHVQIWTINLNVCRQRFASINYPVTNNMLCSGWLDVGGRDQCFGDSGGPLFHNGVVVGICSWGPPRMCADGRFPGVNARVSNYANWINNNA